jgi:hypothetical protein
MDTASAAASHAQLCASCPTGVSNRRETSRLQTCFQQRALRPARSTTGAAGDCCRRRLLVMEQQAVAPPLAVAQLPPQRRPHHPQRPQHQQQAAAAASRAPATRLVACRRPWRTCACGRRHRRPTQSAHSCWPLGCWARTPHHLRQLPARQHQAPRSATWWQPAATAPGGGGGWVEPPFGRGAACANTCA